MAEPSRLYDDDSDEQPITKPDLRALEGGGETSEPKRGHLSDAGDGLFNAGGDAAEVSKSGDDTKAAAETGMSSPGQLGKGFTNSPELGFGGQLNKIFWSSKKRRAGVVGGGLGVLLIGGFFFVSTLVAGGQLIQLSQILQKPMSHSENTTAVRSKGLLRYAKSGDTGETRVNFLGSKVFGATRDQLKAIGIEFDRNGYTGHLKSATFDTNELEKDTFTQMKGMDPAQRAAFLTDFFDLPPGQVTDLGGGVFGTDFNGLGLKSAIVFKNSSIGLLDNGRIVTAEQQRVMAKFFDIPDIFHPIQRNVTKPVTQKLAAAQELKDEQAREAKLAETPTPAQASAEADMKNQLSTHQKVIGSALLLTAGLCLARSIAGDVPEVNRATIVAPAAINATDKIALGSQVESGQDISAEQVGAATESLTSSSGQSVFAGEALEALDDPTNYGGENIPLDYAQAFSPSNTTANIDSTLGGGDLGKVVCSPLGKVIQGVAGLAILFSGFFDAGSSWAAKGAYAADQLRAVVATAGVFAFIQHEAVHFLSDDTAFPKLLSGAVGGNLLAYGAREASNIGARASGGVALSTAESNQSTAEAQTQETKTFQSKSFAYRVFSPDDSRSLVGHFVKDANPSTTQNVASLATSLTHVGSLFSSLVTNLAAIFIPSARAASPPYQWGFPLYGIPDSIANNPAYANPYTNADTVATLLNSSQGQPYIQKAATCFDVTISGGPDNWDAQAEGDVNPNDQSYINANCSDMSDPNWQRVVLFIFDTRTMEGIACFTGDEQSCDDIGDSSSANTSAAPSPTTTAGATIDLTTLYDDSTSVACATGTKDLGIQTGYTGGKPVQIRVCAIPGWQQDNNNLSAFGVDGADGDIAVNSRVSGAVLAMFNAAKQAGITFQGISSFRTMAYQQSLCPCDGVHVAIPGYSNHQMGLAIDFATLPDTAGPVPGNPVWDWLSKNAASFGYKNYPVEAWHWSPTGN